MELANVLGADGVEWPLGEGGQEEPVELVPVELAGSRRQDPTVVAAPSLEPGLGVDAELNVARGRVHVHADEVVVFYLATEGLGVTGPPKASNPFLVLEPPPDVIPNFAVTTLTFLYVSHGIPIPRAAAGGSVNSGRRFSEQRDRIWKGRNR
jgi:hypothetical protein